jgi:hypothetical protein
MNNKRTKFLKGDVLKTYLRNSDDYKNGNLKEEHLNIPIDESIFKVIKTDQVEDGSAAVVLGLPCRSYVGSSQTIDVKKNE